MKYSFIELFQFVPRGQRTDRVVVLLALFIASDGSLEIAVRTSAIRELLVSHLRGNAPRNVSDVLRKAIGYVRAADEDRGRRWALTRIGEKLLQRVLGKKFPTPERRAEGVHIVASMHPEIRAASEKLLADGHPTEALGRAVKRLNQMTRSRTGRTRDEGTSMMFQVFSPKTNNHKRLVLGKLEQDWQRDRQEGLQFMMAGMQAAVANVDKHGDMEIANAAEVTELLGAMSFLARWIDRCELVERQMRT